MDFRHYSPSDVCSKASCVISSVGIEVKREKGPHDATNFGFKCRGADKSLARPSFQYIWFDGENISFDACLVLYIYIYIYIYI